MPGQQDLCDCKLCGKKMGINRYEVCRDCRKEKCKNCGGAIYSLKADKLCANCRAREQVRLQRLQGSALGL